MYRESLFTIFGIASLAFSYVVTKIFEYLCRILKGTAPYNRIEYSLCAARPVKISKFERMY